MIPSKDADGKCPKNTHKNNQRTQTINKVRNKRIPSSLPKRITKVRRPWLYHAESRRLLVIMILPMRMVDGMAGIKKSQ